MSDQFNQARRIEFLEYQIDLRDQLIAALEEQVKDLKGSKDRVTEIAEKAISEAKFHLQRAHDLSNELTRVHVLGRFV